MFGHNFPIKKYPKSYGKNGILTVFPDSATAYPDDAYGEMIVHNMKDRPNLA